jgi:hypothetical protein
MDDERFKGDVYFKEASTIIDCTSNDIKKKKVALIAEINE